LLRLLLLFFFFLILLLLLLLLWLLLLLLLIPVYVFVTVPVSDCLSVSLFSYLFTCDCCCCHCFQLRYVFSVYVMYVISSMCVGWQKRAAKGNCVRACVYMCVGVCVCVVFRYYTLNSAVLSCCRGISITQLLRHERSAFVTGLRAPKLRFKAFIASYCRFLRRQEIFSRNHTSPHLNLNSPSMHIDKLFIIISIARGPVAT